MAWSKLLVEEPFDKKERGGGLGGERIEEAEAVLEGVLEGMAGTMKHSGGGTACTGPGGVGISLGPLRDGVEGTTGMVIACAKFGEKTVSSGQEGSPIAQTHHKSLPIWG